MSRRTDSLRPAIGRAPQDDAWLAFDGARYHLAQLLRAFDSGLETQAQHARFHWHLRAFFWELVAVRDALAFGSKTDQTLKRATAALDKANWYVEIEAYRNFAHRSFHVVRTLRPAAGGKALVFQLPRVGPGYRTGDGRPILNSYVDEMGRFLTNMLSPPAAP